MVSPEIPAQHRTPDRSNDRPGLLLHICCAPCSTHVIDVLSQDFRTSGFFYNPNIYPPREQVRRLEETRWLCRRLGLPLFEDRSDTQVWSRRMRGREGDYEGGPYCSVCFWIRLWRTAREAQRRGFPFLATTLTISPHKNAAAVNHMGELAARRAGIRFCGRDFKKGDGFLHSCRLSERYHLYRQDYCGCRYSLRERRGPRSDDRGAKSVDEKPQSARRRRRS
jgi:predicted adenine nucleotide alpha hydrolase (AANH) superfamily ATPase